MINSIARGLIVLSFVVGAAPALAQQNTHPSFGLGGFIRDFWGPSAAERMQRAEYERVEMQRKAEAEIMRRVLELRSASPRAPKHQLVATALRDPILNRNAVRVPIERQLKIINDIFDATGSAGAGQ